MTRKWMSGLVVAAFLSCESCHKQAHTVFVQPPAATAKAKPDAIQSPEIPEPPKPASSGVRASDTPGPAPLEVPPPPPEPKRTGRGRTAKPASPAPVAAAPAPAPAEDSEASDKLDKAPRLGVLLTAEEQQQLNAKIDQELKQANTVLAAVATKNLSVDLRGLAAQIRSFVTQAEMLRKSDLESAKGIAHKAAVLAADLERSAR
ncbi:MAG: hypothetical protein JO022_18275 [Acidobacteriaceae bacterium]|nr:hypothetical protein [Acidobacteriaceae bacterium]